MCEHLFVTTLSPPTPVVLRTNTSAYKVILMSKRLACNHVIVIKVALRLSDTYQLLWLKNERKKINLFTSPAQYYELPPCASDLHFPPYCALRYGGALRCGFSTASNGVQHASNTRPTRVQHASNILHKTSVFLRKP